MMLRKCIQPAFLSAIQTRVCFFSASSTPPKIGRGLERVKLLDVDGKIVGIKTLAEAEAMAKKDNLLLVKKHDPEAVKYKTYALTDPKKGLEPRSREAQ